MILDSLFKYGFNIDTFHRFSYFLGTDAGELLKNFVEIIFLSIIVYMLISEFKKNGKRINVAKKRNHMTFPIPCTLSCLRIAITKSP